MKEPGTVTSASRPTLTRRQVLILVVVAIVPYLLLPPKPLIQDAHRTIVENEIVREGSIVEILTTDYWGVDVEADYATRSYRPLTTLTFAIQMRLFGDTPQIYHLTDMALHVLGTLLVALLLMQLARPSPWAVPLAALFAVHPVLSEAIVSAVGRADLMASVAMLGGLLLYVRGPIAGRPWLMPAGVVGLGVVALLSKEYAVVYPFLLAGVGLVRWAITRTEAGARREDLTIWGASAATVVAYLGLRLALFGELGGVPMLGAGDHPLFGKPWDVRWATASILLVHAAELLVVPTALNYFYGYGTLPIAEGLADPRVLPGVALVLALVVAGVVVLRRRRDPRVLVAAMLFLFPLGPSLNTVSIAGVLFAERFLYLPAVGFVLLVSVVLDTVAAGERGRRFGTIAVALVAVVFGVATMARVEDWRSPRTLAEASLEHYPRGAPVLFELGLARGGEGDHEGALEAFDLALEVHENRPQVWNSKGVALLNLGRYDEAIEAFERAIELTPDDVYRLWRRLGDSQLAAQRFEDAAASLERAHELEPADAPTRSSLQKALIGLARKQVYRREAEDALATLDRLAAMDDLPAETLFQAGMVARDARRPEKAVEFIRKALELEPDLPQRKLQRAAELNREGAHLEAATVYRELLALEPDDPRLLAFVGRSLLLGGEPAPAGLYLSRSLQFRDDPNVRRLLEEARRRVEAERSSPPPTSERDSTASVP
jgi:tetratricopeptide (TPR) repeat protein